MNEDAYLMRLSELLRLSGETLRVFAVPAVGNAMCTGRIDQLSTDIVRIANEIEEMASRTDLADGGKQA